MDQKSALADEQADCHRERMARLIDGELFRAHEPTQRRLSSPPSAPWHWWQVLLVVASLAGLALLVLGACQPALRPTGETIPAPNGAIDYCIRNPGDILCRRA